MQIIAGTYKSRRLVAPKHDRTRPTSSALRGAFFNICRNQIEGATFLDLFAGSGAIGLEALSRGALSATFLERDREALKALHTNIASLGVADQCHVMSGDVQKVLPRLKNTFSLIYADPPYEAGPLTQWLLDWIDTSSLLAPQGHFFLEEKVPPDSTQLQRLRLIDQRERLYHYA